MGVTGRLSRDSLFPCLPNRVANSRAGVGGGYGSVALTSMEAVIRILGSVGHRLTDSLPRFSRGVVDCLVIATVFLVAGHVSLGYSLDTMIKPLPPFVAILFSCMLVSGAYCEKVRGDYLKLLLRTLLAFLLAAVPIMILVGHVLPGPNQLRFAFFFLFLAFFVMNTLQPLIVASDKRRSGTSINGQTGS